jgi:hypothetical protein
MAPRIQTSYILGYKSVKVSENHAASIFRVTLKINAACHPEPLCPLTGLHGVTTQKAVTLYTYKIHESYVTSLTESNWVNPANSNSLVSWRHQTLIILFFLQISYRVFVIFSPTPTYIYIHTHTHSSHYWACAFACKRKILSYLPSSNSFYHNFKPSVPYLVLLLSQDGNPLSFKRCSSKHISVSCVNQYWTKHHNIHCRDSSVGIATRYGLDGQGIKSRWERDFSHLPRPALGSTQPPKEWIQGLSLEYSGRGVALTTLPI